MIPPMRDWISPVEVHISIFQNTLLGTDECKRSISQVVTEKLLDVFYNYCRVDQLNTVVFRLLVGGQIEK